MLGNLHSLRNDSIQIFSSTKGGTFSKARELQTHMRRYKNEHQANNIKLQALKNLKKDLKQGEILLTLEGLLVCAIIIMIRILKKIRLLNRNGNQLKLLFLRQNL